MVDQGTLMDGGGGRAVWEVAVVERPRSRAAEVLASVPAIIAGAGEKAAWRFLEFFTANIRNKNTRRAYAHAVRLFCAWLGERGISDLAAVNPVLVAAYVEHLGRELSKPSCYGACENAAKVRDGAFCKPPRQKALRRAYQLHRMPRPSPA